MQQTDNTYCKNGDIFMADLPEDREGSLQSGIRPVLVISNNLANFHSPVITIIPLTSRTHKKPLPTHVVINERGFGLEKRSVVLAEQIMSINKKQLKRKIGSISATAYVEKVKKAISIQLSL